MYIIYEFVDNGYGYDDMEVICCVHTLSEALAYCAGKHKTDFVYAPVERIDL